MRSISESNATSIGTRTAKVRARVCNAAREANRKPETVRLIGVSKTQPVESVVAAYAAGLRDFGENYLQEALPKIAACSHLDIVWHYIGAIQSNKTRQLAAAFDWIHTVDRVKIANRLNAQCPPGKTLNVCLQINIDEDPNKNGVAPADAAATLAAISGFANLRVRGLMTIGDPGANPAESYGALQRLFHALAALAPGVWDTLSMGMSGDFPAAIAAGATQVRVGTAIFGPRARSNP